MHMRNILVLMLSFLVFISCQESKKTFSKENEEIEAFLTQYKNLLKATKFDSVALLYVDSGFVSLADGKREVQTIDTVKAFYSRFPKTPNDFRWEKTRIDILSENAALVTGFFYWEDRNSPDTIKQSYTGVYVKTEKGWKIKHEHESLDFATIAKIISQPK